MASFTIILVVLECSLCLTSVSGTLEFSDFIIWKKGYCYKDEILHSFPIKTVFECAAKCQREPNCHLFQFSKARSAETNSTRGKVTCDILDQNITQYLDAEDRKSDDQNCNIYIQRGILDQLEFGEILRDSNFSNLTNSRQPNSLCNQLPEEISFTCECFTADKRSGSCRDIFCSVLKNNKAFKFFYINLDPPLNKFQSTKYCNDFNRFLNVSECIMTLLTIRSQDDQDLVCNVLDYCLISEAKIAFWLGIWRESVDKPWTYDIGKENVTYEAWAEQATRNINKCATLSLSSHAFHWDTDVCEQATFRRIWRFFPICECDFKLPST